ncbi:HotDog domain-containing protein [Apiosordaria backusii]|uniref:HotDog domain-containing protein n=1 Tax=Apiosordaria backusii TaxID=314023 RepID=A0AA40BK42_9PEZI|nr:HotDog domain-containing protein [Apiosordaria backusii]
MATQDENQNPQRQGPAVKPDSAPENHNQFVQDPLSHFRAMPFAAALLSDPAVFETIVPDRRPLASGESNFARKVMNTGSTVRACVSFLRTLQPPSAMVKRSKSSGELIPMNEITKSKAILQGGGPQDGEDPKNPFLLCNALLDLGEDLCSYAGMMHGGLFAVLMDEVMGTAANFQAEHGAYTAQFNTNFRRPIKLPMVVLVRGRVVKKTGRKIMVRGCIEDKNGNIMAEGDGLFIQMDKKVGRSQL